jgi:hypothetical protein
MKHSVALIQWDVAKRMSCITNIPVKGEGFRAPSDPHPSLSHKAGEGKRIQTALLCRAIVTMFFATQYEYETSLRKQPR